MRVARSLTFLFHCNYLITQMLIMQQIITFIITLFRRLCSLSTS